MKSLKSHASFTLLFTAAIFSPSASAAASSTSTIIGFYTLIDLSTTDGVSPSIFFHDSSNVVEIGGVYFNQINRSSDGVALAITDNGSSATASAGGIANGTFNLSTSGSASPSTVSSDTYFGAYASSFSEFTLSAKTTVVFTVASSIISNMSGASIGERSSAFAAISAGRPNEGFTGYQSDSIRWEIPNYRDADKPINGKEFNYFCIKLLSITIPWLLCGTNHN